MMFLRRGIVFALKAKPNFLSRTCGFCSKVPKLVLDKEGEVVANNCSDDFRRPPMFRDATKPRFAGYEIELVDDESWRVSLGLAQAWHEERSALLKDGVGDSGGGCSLPADGDPDFDDIDNMRIRGNLFYKIDRGSKEFEEYSFDFHRRNKSSKKRSGLIENIMKQDERRANPSSKKKEVPKESKRKQNDSTEVHLENRSLNLAPADKNLPKVRHTKFGSVSAFDEMGTTSVGLKKPRTPTFNQLTGPYHEPFCLDIYISKASVRACIVHRVTSKVVAVAHSISKDMKFDLSSTRNATACAAVGSVLAQRALADDIHDVVYTPRRGERLEGKLQLVLQSIIDNGINVKVKLKQRKLKKSGPQSIA